MKKQDLCKYADLFYGNGETDRFFEDGLASKWFYIKALCGNTYPHATLPFGKMSVGAYSGGYPTGYGTHYPNSCGGIRKTGEQQKVRGFSHLHQSGTGAIRYYYNYAITTPFYGDLANSFTSLPLENEQAEPGYYRATLGDIACELTVDAGVALHRYTFQNGGGRVAIDFSNDGLDRRFGENFFAYVKEAAIKKQDDGTVFCSGIFSGIKLYFAVRADGANGCTLYESQKETDSANLIVQNEKESFGAVYACENNTLLVRLAFSTVSFDRAYEELSSSSADFDTVRQKAYSVWQEKFSAFKIDTDDEELKTKFYSNLYHSLLKPSDMTGENVLGVQENVISELATFWDQYKTALPLIYLTDADMGARIVRTVANISRTLKKIPCSFGLTDIFPTEEQAKMLGIITLCDAYYMGIADAAPALIDECTRTELARKDFDIFLEKGIFERYTHILDAADACADVAAITKDESFKKELLRLSDCMENAYGKDGLLSEQSEYYEGDRYTYSFRLHKNMDKRIALAGGKENFASMLDRFFGFDGDSVKQLTHLDAYHEINAKRYHRFEGFNNECDMETPYAYIFADRHDRLCEIVHEQITRSFGTGRSGLPGNNDSGGLSSCFIFGALGIFPAAGTGEFLLGCPQVNGAEIALSNGCTLKISLQGDFDSTRCRYVDYAELNGERIDSFRIETARLMQGGTLTFFIHN